jgi:hypothetical protein
MICTRKAYTKRMTYFNWKSEVKKSRGRQGQKLIVQNYSCEIFMSSWDTQVSNVRVFVSVYVVQAYRWNV